MAWRASNFGSGVIMMIDTSGQPNRHIAICTGNQQEAERIASGILAAEEMRAALDQIVQETPVPECLLPLGPWLTDTTRNKAKLALAKANRSPFEDQP